MNSAQPGSRAADAGPVLLFFVSLTIAAIIGQTWWAVAQDRLLTLESEQGNGLIAVRLLEEHASQTLQDAERKLDTVAAAIAQDRHTAQSLQGEQILQLINQGLHDNRFLTALQYTNPAGENWVTSLDYPAFQFDAYDRNYLRFLLRHPEHKGAIIGHPLKRFYDQQLVLPIARNLYDSKQRYLGVISTDISISYFSNVYARVAKNSNALVSLFANEGFVVLRSPFEMRYLDMDISAHPMLRQLNGGAQEGSISGQGFLDERNGGERLYTYRKISGYPLTTVFARDYNSILAAWKKRSIDRALFSGATIGFILILTFFLLQHIRRLHRSEASLRNSESKFASLFQHSPVPLALKRLDSEVLLEINDALLQQSGYSRDEVCGKTSNIIGWWVYPHERQAYLDLLLKQQSVDRIEVHMRRRDGSVAICQLSARLLDTGVGKLILFSPIDITRQREIENQIRELNTELEQRVRQRTEKLENANQELGQALTSLQTMQSELFRSEKMAALGSLVAGVAHELNTPIGNSVTVASTLQESANQMLSEVRGGNARRSMLDKYLESSAKGAEILVRNLHRAAELVSSFKQVAVDQSSNQKRHFDLRQVLEEVVITLEPLYKKTPYNLHLDLQSGINMNSYPGPLGQVVTNFITNALAHAFEGREQGNMYLDTHLLPDGQVEICFSDDGVGIREQHLERVFDPFFTTKLGQGGSGLGMHIVYNLVSGVLGGRIALHSEFGKGTRLSMILPLQAPEAGESVRTSQHGGQE
ncbi:ATP-binding protein [Massilia sp. W12]|uniref:ATP-binding protein n=1 Tax=Massilia sp. W12 TaxID=3126507 RepID=UPI0030D2F546